MFCEYYLTSSSNGGSGSLPMTSPSVSAQCPDSKREKMDLSYRNYRISVWIYETTAFIGNTLCSSSTAVRRRFHSRRSLMTLLSTCFFTIVFYHLIISTVSSIRRSRRNASTSISSRFLSESMRSSVNESSNFTQHLWLFKNSDAERIYLYTKLLSEYEWQLNSEHLHQLRREINNSPNATTDYLVMTRKNVRIGEGIRTYVKSTGNVPTRTDFFIDEKFMAALPETSPIGRKQYKTCAVIGNSGSLKNTSCGVEINSMDYVFRCNAAPLEEFREDAGMKTDFMTFNPSILFKQFAGLVNDTMVEKYIQYMKQYPTIVWYPCFGSKKLIEPCLQAMSYRDRIDAQLVVGHSTHYLGVWDFWSRRGFQKRPSTGLYLTNVAVTMCEEINLYGFWPFPVEMTRRGNNFTEVPYHYFNDLPFTKNHNSDLEFRILIQLHMQGVLNLHTGACNS